MDEEDINAGWLSWLMLAVLFCLSLTGLVLWFIALANQ